MYKGHVTLSFFFIFAGVGRDGVWDVLLRY